MLRLIFIIAWFKLPVGQSVDQIGSTPAKLMVKANVKPIATPRSKAAENQKRYRQRLKLTFVCCSVISFFWKKPIFQRSPLTHIHLIKANQKKYDKIKWENLGGKKKVSMKIHQYEWDHLERIVTLGTCPLARGALASTALVVSYMASISWVPLLLRRVHY